MGKPIEEATNFYDFDDVPTQRDIFLIKKSDYEFLMKTWKKYSEDDKDQEHPNNYLEHRWAAIEEIRNGYLIVNVCIDQSKRYHSVLVNLPRESFFKCVKFWNIEKRAYLVVSDDWFKSLSDARYSTFAYVDAIGVKKVLEEKGTIDRTQIESFKAKLNWIAFKYRRYALLSFADSVIVKTTWTGSIPYFYQYNPEELLRLLKEIQRAFKEALNFDSFVIVTQGTTEDYDSIPIRKSPISGHFSIGSLGSPFAHIFEIEGAVRTNIKNKIHQPHLMYLSRKFFQTLAIERPLKDDEMKNEVSFTSKVSSNGDNHYIPTDVERLIAGFKPETLAHHLWRLRFRYFWYIRTSIKRRLREFKLR